MADLQQRIETQGMGKIELLKSGSLPSMRKWQYRQADGSWSVRYHTRREAVEARKTRP